jgi:hypothetical protein
LEPEMSSPPSWRRHHHQHRIASTIETRLAAPKIATRSRSSCVAARPQASAASAERATSSRKRGSIYSSLHLAQTPRLARIYRCVQTTIDGKRRSPEWLKMKNANAPAVKREEEEDWGRHKWRKGVVPRLAIAPAPSAFPAGQMQETSQAQTERQL